MTPKLKFAEGEKVLCFHGPLIYEAKALKCAINKDKQVKLYIHYAGWNKNWDEWVPESRVLKYNEQNVQKQKELFKQHSSLSVKKTKATSKGKKAEVATSIKDGATSSGGSESRASTPSKDLNASGSTSSNRGNRAKPTSTMVKESDTSSRKDDVPKDEIQNNEAGKEDAKKKRGGSASSTGERAHGTSASINAPNVNEDESLFAKSEIRIKLPDELKQSLADDWDAITRQHKLIDIPSKMTVQDIIDQYIAYKKSTKTTGNNKEGALVDILNGVIEYFNVMLGSQLLYKFERPQYAEVLQQHPETPPSKLYGSYHLLRLFIKLGSMLGYSGLDDKTLQSLLVHLNEFIKYLAKNNSTYFTMSNYVNVTPEYHRNTQ